MQARRENLRRGHRSLERLLERLTAAYLKEVIRLDILSDLWGRVDTD